jgi:hypothetical protein
VPLRFTRLARGRAFVARATNGVTGRDAPAFVARATKRFPADAWRAAQTNVPRGTFTSWNPSRRAAVSRYVARPIIMNDNAAAQAVAAR